MVGLIVGLTDVSSSALLVRFGLYLATAAATDLQFATFTKLPVAHVHHKNQFIDWQATKDFGLVVFPQRW